MASAQASVCQILRTSWYKKAATTALAGGKVAKNSTFGTRVTSGRSSLPLVNRVGSILVQLEAEWRKSTEVTRVEEFPQPRLWLGYSMKQEAQVELVGGGLLHR